jgi:hypothetical protein
MAVALTTGTTAPNPTGAVLTFSHTVGAGDTCLVVRFAGWRNGRDVANSTVTFGGVSLTKVGVSTISTGGDFSAIYQLVNPSASTANIVITLGTTGVDPGNAWGARADNTSGVDTTTPTGTYVTSVGSSTGPSDTAAGATDDLVLDAVGWDGTTATAAVGGGQTAQLNSTATGSEGRGASSEAGAASVVMSWTLSVSATWAHGAVAFKAGVSGQPLAPTGVDSEEALGSASLAAESVQTAGPASDVAAGAWTPSTGVDLFAMVDEPAIDDTDWIQSSVNPQADLAELALGPLTDPGSSDGHVIQYRIRLVS